MSKSKPIPGGGGNKAWFFPVDPPRGYDSLLRGNENKTKLNYQTIKDNLGDRIGNILIVSEEK